MTTYEFKSGLRLALMKLQNSVSSGSGLPPSPTVDLRHAEERMAARLAERLGLRPPVDVEALCRSFADLSYKNFPIEIDGICLDLKIPGKRPKVWVSRTIPEVRKRFTLAHEIGHIIIPWHSGTIVDDIEAPSTHEKSKYREMEAEANRFAAELLMPSGWTAGMSERCDHVAGLMHSIREIAQVSFPAAFLKSAKFGRPGFIGAEVKDGVILRSVRTPETHSKAPEIGALAEHIHLPAAHQPKIIHGPDTLYYWWRIRDHVEDPGNEILDWRRILDEILSDIPPEFRLKTRSSVNAIVGLAIGREPKGADVGRIFARGLEASQNRDGEGTWVQHVLAHARFEEYILARARERAAQ